MTRETSKYRKAEIERVQEPKTQYLPTIKIANGCNSTNYMNITHDELESILALLTNPF